MRKNKLRELIDNKQPSIGARVLTPWPGMIEVIANTNAIDYIEFIGEYTPWDLHDLENIGRAAELHNVSTMFKVDQEPNGFLAQRALGSGIQNILFTDIRSVEDAKKCIKIVRPEIPGVDGINGCHMRRNVGYVLECGSQDYVQAMKDSVIAIMVEKKGCIDNLEEILSLAVIGKKHILNEQNLIQYFKEVEKAKLYELKRHFHENTSYQIKNQLDHLQERKLLSKGKNGWYGLRRK